MFRKICLIGLIIFSVSMARAEDISVNGRPAENGATLNLFASDLEKGNIVLSLTDEQTDKTEISVDQGKTWQKMDKKEGSFRYAYRPLGDEIIRPEFVLSDNKGGMRTLDPGITINYQANTPEENVAKLLDKLQSAYESENIDRFIRLFVLGYPDRIKFQEAIQQDFYNYRNIRLHPRIESKTFNEDYTRAIWNVYWQRKYDNRSGTGYSDSATITMLFEREGPDWLIIGMNNNAIFGSSLLTSPDLKVTAGDINITDVAAGQVSISAAVHNIGLASASNVKVSFYQKLTTASNFTLIDSKTIASINAGSSANSASVSFTANSGATYDFKIVVDPDYTISEGEESNNSATLLHTMP
ncbi:MAG: hypothetical protein FJZ10_05820 [Candidatus Omnitrophica bacterium]|nr:hypothetical protein [Candidatus Omnitrophota bacterium]